MNEIELFLLGLKPAESIPPELMRDSRLYSLFYLYLPKEHSVNPMFRSSFLVASVRHIQIRDNLVPLVRAWLEAGIEIAFLKGFRFAEFEYEHPAERFYGDVDILILPNSVEMAKKIAVSLNWSVFFDFNDSLWTGSHAAVLVSADNLVSLELHCVILQSNNGFSKSLAKAFWNASTLIDWQATRVRELLPVDAVLCMYLNRAWGDYYGRKLHDILDVRTISKKYSLTREQLEARAKQLGVGLALKVAMRTCDPWRNILKLGRRSKLEVWWDSLNAFPNWRAFAFDLFFLRLSKAPILATDVIEGWGLVRFAKMTLVRELDLNLVLQNMLPEKSVPSGNSRVKTLRLERGVRWALRLMNQHIDACVPRSLALFHALRKEGLEVSFVSGVRRNNNKLEGHAWLELDGKPIVGLGDEAAPQMFKENFRYPSTSSIEADHILTNS